MTIAERTLLTKKQLAEKLAVSVRHVDKLDASGRLPMPIRLGRSKRWDSHEIESWIDAGCPNRDRWQAIRAAHK